MQLNTSRPTAECQVTLDWRISRVQNADRRERLVPRLASTLRCQNAVYKKRNTNVSHTRSLLCIYEVVEVRMHRSAAMLDFFKTST
jgi:hypothetical protein